MRKVNHRTTRLKTLPIVDPISLAVRRNPWSCGISPSWKENGGIVNVRLFKSKFSEFQIAKNGKYSYYYARLTGREFPLGEPAIAKDVECAYLYARYILQAPFPICEPLMAKCSDWSYYYARDVIRGPFKLGEFAIAQDSRWSFLYALNVLFLPYAQALIWQEIYKNGIVINKLNL